MAAKKIQRRTGPVETKGDCVVRVTQAQALAVDQYVRTLQRNMPGVTVSRSDAVRVLLNKVLISEGILTEADVYGPSV